MVVLNLGFTPKKGQSQTEAEEQIFECLAEALLDGESSFFGIHDQGEGESIQEMKVPHLTFMTLDEVTIPTPRTVLAKDLLKMTGRHIALIGDGGRSVLVAGDAYESSKAPGMIVADTEFGAVYLDPETEVKIAD